MKITGEQRNAASLYWTQILTRELNPEALKKSKQGLPPMMARMEAMHTQAYMEELEKTNPKWPIAFMMTLDELLMNAEENTILQLDYSPQDLLEVTNEQVDLPKGFFPTGKLTMTFDDKGNIIVGGEKINAQEFLTSASKKTIEALQLEEEVSSPNKSEQMKITGEQCNAASLYWTKILSGELNPEALKKSKQGLPPMVASMEALKRRTAMERIQETNPVWTLAFKMALDELLMDAESSIYLQLDNGPKGLLKDAAANADIPKACFPDGHLTMTFDKKGNIIVGEEVINADEFVNGSYEKKNSAFEQEQGSSLSAGMFGKAASSSAVAPGKASSSSAEIAGIGSSFP